MMHIDEYSFGRIVIDKKTYTSDVIIYPDRVDSSWWRKEGHYLQKTDLTEVIDERPNILIVGTGSSGVMHVPENTIRFLESKGITVYIDKTENAVEIFNKQSGDKKLIGAFHLTC